MRLNNKKIIFLLFLLPFLKSNAQKYDVKLLQSINSVNTRNDKIWLGVTYSAIPISFATPITFFAFGHFNNLPDGKKNSVAALGGLAINTALTFGLKYTIQRERPFTKDLDVYQKTDVGPYSFPSGHTSLAFATATNITLAYPKWYVALPAYIWAGSVGYSRMHLGVHYPSDVLAGAIVGTLSGFLAFKVNQKFNK